VDCRAFDGQVVRLERLQDVADKFVRVRLTRIDPLDLNLFDFDYDLTLMIFFLSADEKVYARYGGRDAVGPDTRQSLDGLRYTMKSVLHMHEQEEKAFAPRAREGARTVRDLPSVRRGGCMHCHQVKEAINADLQRSGQWERDMAWRYPLPDNLGLKLEVDRGNVVKAVKDNTPAAALGLQPGDVLQRLNGVPIHSFADAQFALDRAPKTGAIEAGWQRGDRGMKGDLSLPEGWRRSELNWRPSMSRLVPSARLYGDDLTAEEKKALGLSATQLAFRQKASVPAQAAAAGIRGGDVILGVDDRQLDMDVTEFVHYVQRNYLVGDKVAVNVLRDGKRLSLTMTLQR
jgi:predicted metalloprotease with PDZ domain